MLKPIPCFNMSSIALLNRGECRSLLCDMTIQVLQNLAKELHGIEGRALQSLKKKKQAENVLKNSNCLKPTFIHHKGAGGNVFALKFSIWINGDLYESMFHHNLSLIHITIEFRL
ncbi:beta-Ala-His dipeptidase [Platysternon megacephalum]|uniref:Beta-Ala-His dipeptidase n=1 Tax=Platysternon megacephalum TaxID=55544 RepID=A0A4D9EQN9_9SAUR|nr:beta-Ala-His dipeptidase [Platysternon megacephalum]